MLNCCNKFRNWRHVKPRNKARGPNHPQRVITKTDIGIKRCTERPRHQVDGAIERVDQGRCVTREFERHGVDREVASRQVNFNFVGVLNIGLASVRVIGLGTVRGDFINPVAFAGPDRSELFTLGPDGVGPPTQ